MFESKLMAAALVGGALCLSQAAQAGTFTSLLSLGTGSSGLGATVPLTGFVAFNGALYGTSQDDGLYTTGTVYQFNPTRRHEIPIYNFSESSLGAGFSPGLAGLSTVGAIAYGTTTSGVGGNGSVYRIDLRSGTLTVLYGFHGGLDSLGSPNGVIAAGGLLYGTAAGGSVTANIYNGGTFSLDPVTGTYNVLHAFTGGADGGGPALGLVRYKGFLFGTATTGGAANDGVLFKIDLHTGNQTVVHSFSGAADGSDPLALLPGSSTLYGVAKTGGANGDGTIFSVNPMTGATKTLHSFAGATDGAAPIGGLTLVGNYLYGTTSTGGAHNQGVLFRVNSTTGEEDLLHVFSGKRDGGTPTGSLVYVQNTLYGTTALGGTAAAGTIFQYVP